MISFHINKPSFREVWSPKQEARKAVVTKEGPANINTVKQYEMVSSFEDC